MTSNYHIYRILYLNCNKVIRLKENIYILPSEVQEIGASIYFEINSFSYLLIKTNNEDDNENLRQTLELIISFFSLLLGNQFYSKENYHFYFENKILLKNAHLYPIPEPFVEKHHSSPSRVSIKIIQFIFKQWYKDILDNRVKDSVFHIIAELNAGLRNTLFEISAGLLWNAWEHLASKYWKIDKNELYVIKKDKFNDFIKVLKGTANNFIDGLKPGDILLKNILNGRYDYKSLLKRDLSKDTANYSPANYRIYQMFDKEGETLANQEIDFITIMNRIRNDLYHKGLSLKEIGEKENINPVEFLVKYKSFSYRKFLEFFGIINKFANYADGLFQWKDEIVRGSNNQEFIELNDNLLELYKYIKRLNKINGFNKKAELRWNNKTNKIRVKFLYDLLENDHYVIMTHLPMDYKKKLYNNVVICTKKNNQPEDLVRLIQPTEVIIDLGDFRATIIIRINKPTETNFDSINIITNRNDPNEFAKFPIGDIIFEKK
ncbi:MAG: hypothetical protein V3V33_10760 [Candidatus Lokiarchaeia archaeon]